MASGVKKWWLTCDNQGMADGGTRQTVDDGRAYGRSPGTWDPRLVEVGAGTPSGELLRRYWHPVARSSEATAIPR